MKSRIPHTLAALMVSGAVPFAHAQSTIQPPANLVAEPVASVSRADDRANAIVQALIADASLKHSKITVAPDEANILLTGTTLTEAQKMRATQIATQHAGEGKVVNTISHDENVIAVPAVATASQAPAESAETTPAATPEQKP